MESRIGDRTFTVADGTTYIYHSSVREPDKAIEDNVYHALWCVAGDQQVNVIFAAAYDYDPKNEKVVRKDNAAADFFDTLVYKTCRAVTFRKGDFKNCVHCIDAEDVVAKMYDAYLEKKKYVAKAQSKVQYVNSIIATAYNSYLGDANSLFSWRDKISSALRTLAKKKVSGEPLTEEEQAQYDALNDTQKQTITSILAQQKYASLDQVFDSSDAPSDSVTPVKEVHARSIVSDKDDDDNSAFAGFESSYDTKKFLHDNLPSRLQQKVVEAYLEAGEETNNKQKQRKIAAEYCQKTYGIDERLFKELLDAGLLLLDFNRYDIKKTA